MSQIAAVLGLEQHHPIMNKLWVHGDRTNRQTPEVEMTCIIDIENQALMELNMRLNNKENLEI